MKSHCINGHPYTEENTEHRKDGTFCCVICRRNRQNYAKAVRRGEKPDDPRPFVGERVADLLEIDGGWWTVPGIALRLGVTERSVYRALSQLGELVEDRVVELAYAMWGSDGLRDWRHEWRYVLAQRVSVR